MKGLLNPPSGHIRAGWFSSFHRYLSISTFISLNEGCVKLIQWAWKSWLGLFLSLMVPCHSAVGEHWRTASSAKTSSLHSSASMKGLWSCTRWLGLFLSSMFTLLHTGLPQWKVCGHVSAGWVSSFSRCLPFSILVCLNEGFLKLATFICLNEGSCKRSLGPFFSLLFTLLHIHVPQWGVS